MRANTLRRGVTPMGHSAREIVKKPCFTGEYWSGAGGGTRTHTTFYGPRILSPVRLPFRHTGNLPKSGFKDFLEIEPVACAGDFASNC